MYIGARSGTETPEQVATRMQNARDELAHGASSPLWEAHIVNGELQASYEALRKQVLAWYPSLGASAKL